MKILVIILIIVAIVQSIIFVWCDLLQYIRGKREAVLQETVKNVHQDFMTEKEKLRELIDERDKVIDLLRSELRVERHRVELLERQLEVKGSEQNKEND